MSGIGKISVLVLSWNGRHHLEQCLPALRQQDASGRDWEVLVLDNGSSDGTAEWVARHHPWVRLVHSPVNLGFCAGNNRLVAEAGGDALVFLNNDTRPSFGWLRALAAALDGAPGDVAAVSGQIVDWTGDRLDFARGILTFDGHAFQLDHGRPLDRVKLPESGAEMLFACGGNMIVRRSSYLDAGGFDESYFAYLEDVDLGWRLWSGGERVLFEPEAVVHHRSMATSELLGIYHRGLLFERNAFLTAYKNFDDELWGKLMPAVLLTLIHRTQTLLVENNPGGELLALDPYAGWIGDTAGDRSSEPALPSPGLWQKFRGYGPREFLRRGTRKAARALLPDWILDPAPATMHITDERTVAQLRAIHRLFAHLDAGAAERRRIANRRRRCDREIFERFPLWVVPTYPGDERLFESPAFRGYLSTDVPLRHAALDEVMSFPG